MSEKTTIGIVGVSTQSGRAFLADLLSRDMNVYAYARRSKHGVNFVKAVQARKGIELVRPKTMTRKTENTCFHPLKPDDYVGFSLRRVIQNSDVLILPLPAIYHEDTVEKLIHQGLKDHPKPLILSPSRTLATPFLWKLLGEEYPILSLSTCPYSCKELPGSTIFIKTRKRSVSFSYAGRFPKKILSGIRHVFPQLVCTDYPATTSLGNIGAVFHPATYILNWDNIKVNPQFSFYIEGIAKRPEVGAVLEDIDQVRLEIVHKLGLPVIGLREDPGEDEWEHLMLELRTLESQFAHRDDIVALRALRSNEIYKVIHNNIVSAQHWLDYTYGVKRIRGESLSSAIGRTKNYQFSSVPQYRYILEDVPTGLIPFKALAEHLDIDVSPIDHVLSRLPARHLRRISKYKRELSVFDFNYIKKYLSGKLSEVI